MKDDLIEVREGAGGESAYITGTRTPVRHIVGYYRMFLDELIVARICTTLPYLTAQQVEAAIEYWRSHEEAIAKEMADEEAALARLQEPA